MSKFEPIPIVDLFAGPGGLGEGFSSIDDGLFFKILVSAEMDSNAHQTLKLRSFYRTLKRKKNDSISDYYKYCNGESSLPYSNTTKNDWLDAENEARQLTLGTKEDNSELINIIKKEGLSPSKPWVLIGGPPCQAYSLAGRSRNQSKLDYRAEDDHRHFLYKEYLSIIQQFKPAVFVMENVKGILSSKINEHKIFHSILLDLSDPDRALNQQICKNNRYKIYSLSIPTVFTPGMLPNQLNIHDFIIRSEEYGIPQTRHRVILLGVREDIKKTPELLVKCPQKTVLDAIGDLPILRSKISKGKDDPILWKQLVENNLNELTKEIKNRDDLKDLHAFLSKLSGNIISEASNGAIRFKHNKTIKFLDKNLCSWYEDDRLKFKLNHEARSHMASDLLRYLYASSYATVFKTSPKGHEQYNIKGLRPNHTNWESGNFADRFRVQLLDRPSTTITSHISKDGHYYIHPDPKQCRSFTVREAARLQTFPDNYFFQGNRTQQFHQVGNAVPPLLAYKIAEIVKKIIS